METGSLAIAIGKAAAPSAISFLTKVGKQKYDEYVATYTNIFADHVRATAARCSTIKTLLHRDEAVSIDAQYVPLTFTVGDEQDYTDNLALEHAKRLGSAMLISGLAGCGKSMFMKWVSLRLIESIPNTQRIPIFIEIREVRPERLSLPFDEMIFQMSSSDLSQATLNQFRIGLIEGQFIIIVDGLDEVPVKYREAAISEISDFQRRFPKASLVCSTRPDRQAESSTSLKILHVNKMTLSQITNVIRCALFNIEKKEAFINTLNDGLYDNHESFLSNPLLATIMLITFDMSTGVPNKLSLFYSQVFESLFYKHDSSKGVYVREHHCNLDIDQFERSFRTFAFQSYAMSKVSFGETDLMELMKTSIEQSGITVNTNDFIKDCKKSLCLLQEDGLFTTFVHRSFQEYFAARFLSYYGGPEYKHLVDEIARRGFSDNTFTMLYQLNIDDVLRRWCLPTIIQIQSVIDDMEVDNPEKLIGFLEEYVSTVCFKPDSGNVVSYSWSYGFMVGTLYKMNHALEFAGITERIDCLRGSIFSPEGKSGVDERYFEIMTLEEFADEHADENDGENETEYTENYELRISELEKGYVLDTGFPSIINNLRLSLNEVQESIQKKLSLTDDFARRVTGLFDTKKR